MTFYFHLIKALKGFDLGFVETVQYGNKFFNTLPTLYLHTCFKGRVNLNLNEVLRGLKMGKKRKNYF